jgi:hypothetical protein
MLRTTAPDIESRNVTFWQKTGNRYKRTYIIERNDKDNSLIYAGKVKGRHYTITRSTVNEISLTVKRASKSQALKEIKEANETNKA